MSLRHTMTKFRSFLQNALVEYIGVYSDTNKNHKKTSPSLQGQTHVQIVTNLPAFII